MVVVLPSVRAGENDPAPTATSDGFGGSSAVIESVQIPTYTTSAESMLLTVSSAGDTIWRTYKNYNAWWGENRDHHTLIALGKTWGVDYFVHPMSDLQSGIPPGTDVVLIASNSMAYSWQSRANRDAQKHPDAQAALVAFLEQGGTVIVDMADNDYPDGYRAPGSVGTPWLYTPEWAPIKPDPVRDVTLDPSAVANGHPFIRGLTNDTIDMDTGMWVAHGNLTSGFEMPPNANILMTATFFGKQEPVLAEYPFGNGLVIVDTITKEYRGHAPAGYPDSYIMGRLFCYVEDPSGGEPPTATTEGPFGPISVDWPAYLRGFGSDPDTTGSMIYEWSSPTGTTWGSESSRNWLYFPPDEPGIYDVTLTVTDMCGLTASDRSYVVVYDPEGPFVTGAGRFDSPPGALSEEPTLTGKANFAFVSKYLKGARQPTGNSQFRFDAADLAFKSESYEWLVVAGSKAIFKCVGAVNGESGIGFIISAIDADLNTNDSFETDRFRIKIWDLDTETVLYDNNLGGEDSTDPATEISSGQIRIQK